MDHNDACGILVEQDLAGPNCDIASKRDLDWQCRVSEYEVCDGFSSCLTDECGCGKDVFICADGVGCIAKDNLCNGFKDCKDGSDECMCDNTVTCYIDEIMFCVPKDMYCKDRLRTYSKCKSRAGEVNCGGIKADIQFVPQNSPMKECINRYFIKMWDLTDDLLYEEVDSIVFNNQTFLNFCLKSCGSGYAHFCPSIDVTMAGGETFSCGNQEQWFDMNQICDGNLDCDNGADEIDCPGRYYCTDIQVWLLLGILF